ncbi:MAG: Ig-like domain-containing protein [Solirubrobacteraceae bacterium]
MAQVNPSPSATTVAVGSLPTGVAATDTTAYVADAQSNTVSVVDLASDQVSDTIAVGSFPEGVALSPDGSTAYVTNFKGGTLSIIDTSTNQVAFTVKVGTDPDGVVQIGSSVYVANLLSGTISIVDPATGTVTGTITLTGTLTPAPSGLATNGDGTHLYVNDARNGETEEFDVSLLPAVQDGVTAVGSFPAYLAINDTTGYVANAGTTTTGTVSVVDFSNPSAPTVTQTIDVGSHPYGIAVDASAGDVLAADSGDGDLSVIDDASNTVISTIKVGDTPDAVAVTPDQKLAIVTNEGDDTITILSVALPVAGGVSFSGAVGNTTFGVGTSPAQPSTSTTGTVLSNSSDPTGGTVSAVAGTIPTTDGGSVSMNSDGTFTYFPPAGNRSGTDTFTFQVQNAFGTSSAQATIDVTGEVWYVDDADATNGSGTAASPFNALSSVTGPGGPTAGGDDIFVFDGSGAAGGGIALKADQLLIGQSQTLTVGGQTVWTGTGANPTITNGSGDGITLANGDTVTGIDVNATTGNGVSSGAGVNSFTLTAGDQITNAGSNGLNVNGGIGTISAGASISGSSGHSVDVQGRTGGTVTVSGAVSDTGTGILLSGNSGATIDFTGGVTASTGSHEAFAATGGGTVNVTGSSNTLATTTADALDVENTTIGSSGLTFQSISAGTSISGPTNGILLSSTGNSGTLTVAGTGSAGSGGTIEHTTDTSDYGGDASFQNSGPVSLSDMTLTGAAENGVGAHEMPSLTLVDNSITGNHENGIEYNLGGLGGTTDTTSGQFDIVGNSVGTSGDDGIRLYFASGGTATGFVTGNTVTGATAGDGIDVFSVGNHGAVTADVANNIVSGITQGFGISGAAQDDEEGASAPTLNLTLTGNHVDLESNAAQDGMTVSSGEVNVATVCLNATANTSVSKGIATFNPGGYDSDGMSVYQGTNSSVFEIVGGPNENAGSGGEDPTVESFLDAHNTLTAGPGPTSQPSFAEQFGSAGFTSAGSCPKPAAAPALSSALLRQELAAHSDALISQAKVAHATGHRRHLTARQRAQRRRAALAQRTRAFAKRKVTRARKNASTHHRPRRTGKRR